MALSPPFVPLTLRRRQHRVFRAIAGMEGLWVVLDVWPATRKLPLS